MITKWISPEIHEDETSDSKKKEKNQKILNKQLLNQQKTKKGGKMFTKFSKQKGTLITLLLCIISLFGSNSITEKGDYWSEFQINEQRNTRNENTTLVGRYGKGAINAVDADGDILYVGSGEYLGIFDYSDAENPVEIGGVNLPAELMDIRFKDNYIYAVSWFAGFYIVDVSDSSNPIPVYENNEHGNRNYGIETNGDFLYINSMNSVVIMNVSDPLNPILENSLPFGATDVAFKEDLMFTAAAGSGLQLGVFDNSSPANPELLTDFYDNGMVMAFSIFIIENKLYYTKNGENMGILDISDIDNIQLIGEYSGSIPGYPAYYWDVTVSGDYAYLANSNYDPATGEAVIFDVINISNPAEIIPVYQFRNPTGSENVAYKVKFDNDKAYVAHQSSGLFAFDVSDNENIELSNHYQSGGTMLGVDVNDGYAYIAEGFAGLYSINVNEPSQPEFAGKFQSEQSHFVENVTVNNNHAYIPDPWVQSCTKGINISEPSEMFEEFVFFPENSPMVPLADDVEFFDDGNKALISYWDGPVFFDVNPDGSLEFISYVFINPTQPVTNTLVHGDYFYCSISGNGTADLCIVNISNISSPQMIINTSIMSEGNLWSLAIKNNILYAGGDDGRVLMFDVTNPSSYYNIGEFQVGPAPVFEMKVHNNYLYIAAGNLLMYQITSPGNPQNIGNFYAGQGSVKSLDVDENGLIYLADTGGLYIIENVYTGSEENDITVFSFEEQFGESLIDAETHSVYANAVPDTDLTDLTPEIEVSAGASVNPPSGESNDFSNPVEFTVVSEAGTEQIWTIYIDIVSGNNDILSFAIEGQIGTTVIDCEFHTVTVNMPEGSSLSSLTPVIEVSPEAVINPPSGETTDFSNPVGYIVTAQNGDVQVWIATAGFTSNNDNCISAKSLNLNNFPNPFNPTTSINFDLNSEEEVLLEIFNLRGQKIKTLISETLRKGSHHIIWDGKTSDDEKVTSGVYLCKLKTGNITSNKKMTLLK